MTTGRVCHFKLVLLGDTAVGKSCLVVRFVRDEFFEYQEPTIGGACGFESPAVKIVERAVVHYLFSVTVSILTNVAQGHLQLSPSLW